MPGIVVAALLNPRSHAAAQATVRRQRDWQASHTRQRAVAGRAGVPLRAPRGSTYETGARARVPAEEAKAGAACNSALIIGRQTSAEDDAVHVRMMREHRALGVQHERGAHVGIRILWISGDGAQCFVTDV